MSANRFDSGPKSIREQERETEERESGYVNSHRAKGLPVPGMDDEFHGEDEETLEKFAEIVAVRPLDKDLLSLANVNDWLPMVVSDDPSSKLCSERMNILYEQKKKLKADRDSVVKPLNEAKAKVDAMVKPILEPLEKAYDTLNRKLGAYLDAKRKRLEEEERVRREAEAAKLRENADKKAAEAAETGDERKFSEALMIEEMAEGQTQSTLAIPQKAVTSEGAKFIPVTRWYARVVDEKLVPREFLVVDTVKLNKVASESKGGLTIPGIEFYSETKTNRR